MQQRFFDIVIESVENGQEVALNREFVLDIPEHDMSTPMDRLEYIGILLDSISKFLMSSALS